MDLSNNRLSPEAIKIQHGLAMANRKMLEVAALLQRNLILGNLEGGFEEKSARELLEEVQSSEWWKEHFEAKE